MSICIYLCIYAQKNLGVLHHDDDLAYENIGPLGPYKRTLDQNLDCSWGGGSNHLVKICISRHPKTLQQLVQTLPK